MNAINTISPAGLFEITEKLCYNGVHINTSTARDIRPVGGDKSRTQKRPALETKKLVFGAGVFV